MIHVMARASAAKNTVTEMSDGSYKITTTAFPEHGKANVAIAKLLARHLRVPLSHITLVRGASSRQKLFRIEE